MQRFLFVLLLLLSPFCLFSQVNQLIRNGDFEANNSLPDNMDQIETKCDYWSRPGNGNTPDYYTVQAGYFRGICPLNSTPNGLSDVPSLFLNQSLPYIQPPNGSLFFAGFGSSEGLSQKLSVKPLKNSKVKVTFWISPRGELYDVNICASLRGKKNSQTISKVIYCVNHYYDLKPLNQASCSWYYIESPWIDLDDNEYDELLIGGSENSAGDITSTGYTYIDDVKLYNGVDCCIDHIIYQNTNNIPNKTHVENYILIRDNVTFNASQNYSLKAGNYIEIEPLSQFNNNSFVEINGALIDIEIEECNPVTNPQKPPIEIVLEPNVFTPNNDGINDKLCFIVNNSESCSISIFNRWGLLVYSNYVLINSNIICVWDGIFSNGQIASEGTYFYHIDFFNCGDQKTSVGFFELFIGGSNRIGNDLTEYSFEIFPNPAEDYLFINEKNGKPFKVELYTSEHKKIYSSIQENPKHTINFHSLNLSTGLYIIKCYNSDEVLHYEKLIIK